MTAFDREMAELERAGVRMLEDERHVHFCFVEMPAENYPPIPRPKQDAYRFAFWGCVLAMLGMCLLGAMR